MSHCERRCMTRRVTNSKEVLHRCLVEDEELLSNLPLVVIKVWSSVFTH